MYLNKRRSHQLLGLKLLIAAIPVLISLSADAVTQAAAFLQPDPITKKLPYQAIKITRDKAVVNSDAPIQACDRIEFVGAQSEIKQVRITTYSGGKNLVLDNNSPVIERIACGTKTISSSMAVIWAAISAAVEAKSVTAFE